MTTNASTTSEDQAELLFSYGTLQLPAVQRATFGREVPVQADAVLGFQVASLTIHDPDVIALSGLRVHRVLRRTGDERSEVEGVVLTLTPAELGRADDYEVAAYVRVRVPLRSGRRAWAYVLRADLAADPGPDAVRA